MLDEVCYIGDCANADLCVPVPVFEDSRRTSQIAFISNPRKALDNDLIKGNVCDVMQSELVAIPRLTALS